MSYADLNGQRSMAFDDVRNEFYEAAIKKIVTPDSVVLDLGSGLGVHALMAARAGARRVFMVEPENVVHCAKEIAKHNGYGDRVEAFQGRIEEVELPEKVDVIISVFTGNLLYSEDLLPSLFYARDKWLKPGGRLIPDEAELWAAPLSATKTYADVVEAWSQPHMGFDFSPLRRYAANAIASDARNADDAEKSFLLAGGKCLATANLRTDTETTLDHRAEFEIERDGLCHGIHTWIRLKTGEQWIATGPIDPPMHWTPNHLLIDSPLSVVAGERVDCLVRRPAYGDWTWDVANGAVKRRQSTFLGTALSASKLALIAAGAKPTLNEWGRATALALSLLDGQHSNSDTANRLAGEFARLFATPRAALRFVQSLAGRYGG